MHKEHLEIAAIDAVGASAAAIDAFAVIVVIAAIRRGAAVADMDRSGVILQRRLSIGRGAIDGSNCCAPTALPCCCA